MRECFDCNAMFEEADFRSYTFCPFCGRNFRRRGNAHRPLRTSQPAQGPAARDIPSRSGIFNNSSEFGVNIGERTLAIDKQKFATIVPRCREWILQNPGRSICYGLGSAIAGSGLVAASAPIIATGAAVASVGTAICTVGAVVMGLGVVVGVVGKDARIVVSALKLGLCGIAAGTGIIVTGMILQNIGYVSLATGLALVGGGLLVAGIAGHRLISNAQNKQAQIAGSATGEQKAILQGMAQTVQTLSKDPRTSGFDVNEKTPVYVLNMKDLNGNFKI